MRRRPWGIVIVRHAIGAPMLSFGIHVDLHTPTLDLYVLRWTVQLGRNDWQGRRFVYYPGTRWTGHSDNCDHPREWWRDHTTDGACYGCERDPAEPGAAG